MLSGFKIACQALEDVAPLREAFEKLAPQPDNPEVWGESHWQALNTLRTRWWKVLGYDKFRPDPEAIPTGEQTMRDIHSVCQDILMERGARELMTLFQTYRITKLADLPANLYPQFYDDARTMYHSERSRASMVE